MSLKSATTRCGLAAVALLSATGLAACGAGQISQTANQVPAVDGASANSEDGFIHLRDVTIHPATSGKDGAIKFAVTNDYPKGKDIKLESITVGSDKVDISGDATIKSTCQLIGDGKAQISTMAPGQVPAESAASVTTTAAAEASETAVAATTTAAAPSTAKAAAGATTDPKNCVTYVVTAYDGTPTAGTAVNVTFSFDAGKVSVDAPVAAPTPKAGEAAAETSEAHSHSH